MGPENLHFSQFLRDGANNRSRDHTLRSAVLFIHCGILPSISEINKGEMHPLGGSCAQFTVFQVPEKQHGSLSKGKTSLLPENKI